MIKAGPVSEGLPQKMLFPVVHRLGLVYLTWEPDFCSFFAELVIFCPPMTRATLKVPWPTGIILAVVLVALFSAVVA